MKPTVLIIEDDETVRTQLSWALAGEFEVLQAADRAGALEMFRARRPDVSLLDLGLPPRTDDPSEGLAALAGIRHLDHRARVIVMTGLTGRATAVEAVGKGACEVLEKPVPIPELKRLVERTHHLAGLEHEFLALQPPDGQPAIEGLHGRSPQMQEILATLRKVADTDAPVLFLGETGTGKERAARAIHQFSHRRLGPFVSVPCGAIPPHLLEAELFGQSAEGGPEPAPRRPGRAEQATGGTLYLEDVSQLPARLQVRLLRFLRDRVIERGEGEAPVPVDARVIAATRTNLARTMVEGRFRDDLYYLLTVVVIRMPPLRERPEDIGLIAEALLQRFARRYGRPPLQLDPAALRALQRHSWPGNVPELENCLRRAAILAESDHVTEADLELTSLPISSMGTDLRQARHQTEREVILEVLRRHHGRIAPASVELGITRPTLYGLMRRLNIRRPGECPPSADDPA